MTTTPPEAPPHDPGTDHGPRVTREEVRDLGRLRRTIGLDRKLAGVGGGLARHLDVDPIIVRVALVVLIFFGGAGLLVYLACWLLVPSEGSDQATVPLDHRNRTIALVGVGGLATLALLADSIGQWGFPWPLILVAATALVVLTVVDKGRRPRPTAPPVPHAVDPTTGAVTPVGFVAGPTPAAPWAAASAAGPATDPATSPTAIPTAGPATSPATSPTVQVATVSYQPRFDYEYASRPARPSRRRGPILFLFTLALAALGCGVLGIVDLAGASVLPSAYPALVAATCGVMLLVASVYGRGGGLILAGLLASLAMLVASLAGPWHGTGQRLPTPATAAEVRGDYRLSAGEIVLDLTRVADPEALAGRTIRLGVRTGRVEVVVPAGLAADVHAHVTGAGHIVLFGEEWDGWDPSGSSDHDPGVSGAPGLTIDATVLFGEIDVHTEGAR